MAFATSDMQLSDFRDAAAAELFLGGSAPYVALDAGETAEIDRLIKRAERTLWLHPPVDPPHVWSCLRDPGLMDLWGDVPTKASVTFSSSVFSSPTTTLTANAASFYKTMVGKSIVISGGAGTFTIASYTSSTVILVTGNASAATGKTFSIASDGTFPLPSDFESPESSGLVFTSQSWVPDAQLMDKRYVDGLRATRAQTGYPQFAYIEWLTSDGTAVQVQKLVTWPEPDQHYEVSMPYAVEPQVMSASTDYPRGGPEMADTLLSMVLAVCEEAKSGRRGDRWAEATQKCQIAARRDKTRHHNFIAGWMRSDSSSVSRPFDVKRLLLPV